jgi:hypothetical protein
MSTQWCSFILHGGLDALIAVDLDRLGAELRLGRIHDIATDRVAMLERQIAEAKKHFEGRKRPSTTLRDMADRVSSLVEKDEGGPVSAYDTLQRAHSLLDVHPPKVLKQMVDLTQPDLSLRDFGPWGEGHTPENSVSIVMESRTISLALSELG